MSSKNRILAFHLLNDRSGSPKVLSQILKSWAKEKCEVILYTSAHENGFLSNIPGIQKKTAWYQFNANPWIRLVYYSLSQFILFFRLLFVIKKTDIVYVNTVLPFGAALAGKIKGAKVIYHVHESTVNPAILKWFLFKIVALTATEIINVSQYVASAHNIKNTNNHLIYNAIDDSFLAKRKERLINEKPENILMVCSLKAYKGVFEFINLAKDYPQFKFRLVLNARQTEIDAFFEGHIIPQNISLYSTQKNLHPFYQWADLIVNLSRPDGWIETFGLTIIEGMAYGLPAIVPPVGGILEVIQDRQSGYTVDSRNRQELNAKIKMLMENKFVYKEFSQAATKRLELFREQKMLNSINQLI
ncbi:glycosyltransferase family 4 protein [Brumimicrobium aurantiacum]|uniref:Glycosyltransferase n=1 Tax=Brumimicrobium aurantiacum TaxID=1737063 RepID=A0A3E1F003_9FLAO|nr:glycosyltransferase family 4 protein [Brumimicrobium aurantiacum]RFC55037.1 glycosyltransferase [Brumimicrobium aurantiacum]